MICNCNILKAYECFEIKYNNYINEMFLKKCNKFVPQAKHLTSKQNTSISLRRSSNVYIKQMY